MRKFSLSLLANDVNSGYDQGEHNFGPVLREYTGVVNNPSSTKLSYSKLKNAVLNPSKSFLALKKVSPRILSTFKRSFSKKKWEKHRAHTLSTR